MKVLKKAVKPNHLRTQQKNRAQAGMKAPEAIQ